MAHRRGEAVLLHPQFGAIPIAMIQNLYGVAILQNSQKILSASDYYNSTLPTAFVAPIAAGGDATGYDAAWYPQGQTWIP